MHLPGFLIGLVLVAACVLPARAVEVSFSTPRTSPELTATLAIGQPFYVEIVYTSDREMRFQAQAFRDGEFVETGQTINARLPQPTGKGSALVWVKFREAAVVDEIRVIAFDAMKKPLAVRSLKANLRWKDDLVADADQPGWVASLQEEQARIDGLREQTTNGNSGIVDRFFGLLSGFVGG
ncbi:hypothetical protein [Mesorhizobium sp. ZC-5]|uniref:hypothetical protein n=1 Tax=Mesorhizobium sp. ZC-5 TaxID=2986066 RepID=UPI0021E7E7C2|nr:hypothetical protein [Mesorhizobium sp. ZC-5]MCV3240899.1 hypothetical protein [Mesorhizobium sp. ZC-5]